MKKEELLNKLTDTKIRERLFLKLRNYCKNGIDILMSCAGYSAQAYTFVFDEQNIKIAEYFVDDSYLNSSVNKIKNVKAWSEITKKYTGGGIVVC